MILTNFLIQGIAAVEHVGEDANDLCLSLGLVPWSPGDSIMLSNIFEASLVEIVDVG